MEWIAIGTWDGWDRKTYDGCARMCMDMCVTCPIVPFFFYLIEIYR
jgi:hypothetical protein